MLAPNLDATQEPAAAEFRALGSQIVVVTREPEQLDGVTTHARTVMETLEQTFSRFRADSELAYVESCAGQPTRCSPLFVELLQLALWAAASTDGWFDPTVRDALEAAGYDRDFAAVLTDGPAPARPALPAGRWRAIRVDAERGLVTLPPATRLDFGGIGKSFAVDRVVRSLPAGFGGALISAGGDLAVAGPPPEGGWLCEIAVGAETPTEQVVALRAGALATSGIGRRRWQRGGQELHHLIDPQTGQPGVSPWLIVSVAAGNCVAAEVAAKVGWLRGYAGPGWVAAQGLAARFQARDGRVVTVGGWPAAASGARP
jgi:thiamine biosynthesis lipoprotein